MKRRLGGWISFVTAVSLLLSACGWRGSASPEKEPIAEPDPAEVIPPIAGPAIDELANGDEIKPPTVESEAIKADAEFMFLEGDDFHAMRKVFENSQVSKYEGGILVEGLTGTEIGFVPLTFARFSVNGKDDGRVMGMGEMGGQQAFVIMDERDGRWHHMAEFTYPDYPQFRDWGLWMGSDGKVPVGFSDGVVPVQIFGTESDLNTGEVVRLLYFDQNGDGHEIKGRGTGGKVAMPEESEIWYLMARDMIDESPNPSEWSWKYAEDGTLQLVRGPISYHWNKDSKLWEEVKGKDYDYAVIEGSETRVELDGYPVSIALGKSVSSKMGDLEFNDPTVFANLMWEVEYQAWLGHKPEAEGKSLAEFKQLVKQAKAGDPVALEAITYQTWLNDMDDQAGYKPLPVTVRPLLGGGWTADGVLQPDEIQVVVVDTAKMQNISPQATLGEGYGFSYMLDPSGRIILIYYVGGVSDNLADRPNVEELYLASNLAQLPEIMKNNKGSKKLPVGNRMTSQQKLWMSGLESAMELKK